MPSQALAAGTDYAPGFIPQSPDGFQTIPCRDLSIRYGSASQGDAAAVADDANVAYAAVEAFFHDVPFHPEVIVASTHEEYESILNAEGLPDYSMSSGWGDGSRSAIVIKRPQAVPNFRVAMTHEMAHIATRSYIRGYKYALPEWFSEGLAVYVSGDLPAAKRGMIEDRCRRGDLMSIEELDRVHRLSSTEDVTAAQVSAAYTQAGLLVEYVAGEYGSDSLLRILDRFGPTNDLTEAFAAVTGRTPDQINREWQTGLKAELDRRDGRILEQAVYGYVVDHHGRPMPNETVSFTALRNDSIVEGTVYKALTNDSGGYAVNVTYGPLRVASDKPEYEGFADTITVARSRSLFLNVTLNGTALEERLAREKAERDRRNMIYIGLGVLTLAAVGTVLAVFARSKR